MGEKMYADGGIWHDNGDGSEGSMSFDADFIDEDALKNLGLTPYNESRTMNFAAMELRYQLDRPAKINVQLDDGAHMPYQGSDGAAGYDLFTKDTCRVNFSEIAMVDTGVHVQIPAGWVGLVFERSSLHKRGLSLANKVGVIDSDYRGSIKLPLRNDTGETIGIMGGERLAQLVLVPCMTPALFEVDELPETDRGDGGFGSTGK